ncbi:hypothetical protein PCASD_06646 [Puccinia coronata f. sp. avenae]|uniref:Uncharacterized protein n=1 Tax=Puccinia coronata f. sp. avenae TaxID=200324 RepID=A0A2N5UGR6_9BASI|nr:hypothetical protein PCASD_06646 [Puccinia coronata f. sp. avenae]
MSQFHANQCQRLFDLVTRWQSSRRRQFLELDALKPESPAWRRSSARHEGHHGVKVHPEAQTPGHGKNAPNPAL